jgi:hypothetical protein
MLIFGTCQSALDHVKTWVLDQLMFVLEKGFKADKTLIQGSRKEYARSLKHLYYSTFNLGCQYYGPPFVEANTLDRSGVFGLLFTVTKAYGNLFRAVLWIDRTIPVIYYYQYESR